MLGLLIFSGHVCHMYGLFNKNKSEYHTRILSIVVLFFLGRGGMRNESRAAKVALMKIKMKATGDSSIPQVCTS